MQKEQTFWEPLLTSIEEKNCLPFIGQESHNSISFADPAKKSLHYIDLDKISNEWAEKHKYPLENTSQISNVAQFLSIKFDSNIFPNKELSRIISKIEPPDFSQAEYDNTPYSVLAKLPLPIYITTNYDHFMEAALINNNRKPVSDFCRWSDYLLDNNKYEFEAKRFSENKYSIKGENLSSVLEQGSDYEPKVDRPLVYHLYGDIAAPASMVLTEKDYFEFVINLQKSSSPLARIPNYILQSLAISSLMFIGYNLEDIVFRTIFQGFIRLQTSNIRDTNISVHVPREVSKEKAELIMEYLSSYAEKFYVVDIHWGNINEFILDLNRRWINYKKTM
ncbi:MAG TPA: SIR2 family protein [Nitrososphaeraceae archaeon]|nr:SIR2 family protein [Nitrososphaeraceae archaeon]